MINQRPSIDQRHDIASILAELKRLHSLRCGLLKTNDPDPDSTGKMIPGALHEDSMSFRILFETPDVTTVPHFISLALADALEIETRELSLAGGNCRLLFPNIYADSLRSSHGVLKRTTFSKRPTIAIIPNEVLSFLRQEEHQIDSSPLTIYLRPECDQKSTPPSQYIYIAHSDTLLPVGRDVGPPDVHVQDGFFSFLLRNLLVLVQDAIVDNLGTASALLYKEDANSALRTLYEHMRRLTTIDECRQELLHSSPLLQKAVSVAKSHVLDKHLLFIGGEYPCVDLFAGIVARELLDEQLKQQRGGWRLLQFAKPHAFTQFRAQEVINSVIVYRDFFALFEAANYLRSEDRAASETILRDNQQGLGQCISRLKHNRSYLLFSCHQQTGLASALRQLQPPIDLERKPEELWAAMRQLDTTFTSDKFDDYCFELDRGATAALRSSFPKKRDWNLYH